jgi:hypothetical protein
MENRFANKTEKELIAHAWEIQDACNPVAVAASLVDMLKRLRELKIDTQPEHHISVQWMVCKLEQLSQLYGHPTPATNHQRELFDEVCKENLEKR